MINLYIVESPLQALCALEVALGKKEEINDVIVRTSGGRSIRNDKQILSLIDKFDWNCKTIICHKLDSKRYSFHFENKFFLNDMAKKYKGKVASLYIGEFRSAFMHMVRVAVKAKNVFLLDDGAVSVNVINKYISKDYYYPYDSFYPESSVKKAIFKVLYKRYINETIFSKKIKVLTAFSNQKNINIEQLTFINIKNSIKKASSIDSSLVYYYGSKYSEVGIVSRDYELYFLKSVKNFYDGKGKKLVYFAHREEEKEKLELIGRVVDCEVVVSDIMAELYLLESNILPSEVSGAYTSILNNVKFIFPEIAIRSFKLKPKEIGQKWRKDIESIYEYYRNLDITIEDEVII